MNKQDTEKIESDPSFWCWKADGTPLFTRPRKTISAIERATEARETAELNLRADQVGGNQQPAAQPQRSNSKVENGIREIVNQYFGVEMSISAERAMERIAAILAAYQERY